MIVRRANLDEAERHVAALIDQLDRIPRARRSRLHALAATFFAALRAAEGLHRARLFRSRAALPLPARPPH